MGIGDDEDNESEGEKRGEENAAGNGNNKKTRKRQRLRDGECWWCRRSLVVNGALADVVVVVVEA